MLSFFDIIAVTFFNLSNKMFHAVGSTANKETAKIQTVFVISGFQIVNVFYIIVDPLLAKYYCLLIPEIITPACFILLLVYNYLRYIYNNKLELMPSQHQTFFNNLLLTRVIMVFYFVISCYLMLKTGDITREIYLNC